MIEDVEQDPLPGMPKPKAKRPRSQVNRPTWTRVRQPRAKRPVMCSECSLQAADRQITATQVQVAVWKRTVNGKLHAHLCGPHAEPLRVADGETRLENDKEKRSWRKNR